MKHANVHANVHANELANELAMKPDKVLDEALDKALGKGLVMGDHLACLGRIEFECRYRGYSMQTIKAYVYHNRKFFEYIKKSPREISCEDIKRYIVHLGQKNYSKDSINLAINSILFYFCSIMKRRFNIKRQKKPKKLFDILTVDEVLQMLDLCSNNKHKLLLEFMYSTGLRVSEVCKLKFSDIDFGRGIGVVRRGKGEKDRIFYLGRVLSDDLAKFRLGKDIGYIFCSGNSHYSNRSAQLIVAKYTPNFGKNITPHSLRRSFATHMIENEESIFKVSQLMGHSDISTTIGYIRNARMKGITSPLDKLAICHGNLSNP